MGEREQSLAKQAMRAGQPLPERIANAPELLAGCGLYLEAFFDLDSERQHGGAPTPIPWSKIKDYAIAFDFNEDQTADLFYLIRQLDSAHLKRLNEQLKNG